MKRRWTNDHGPDGLRDKFSVYKSRERLLGPRQAVDMYSATARIGADGEFVLVLRPETDIAAWLALREYAHLVQFRAPQLTQDIRRELARIDDENWNGA